MNKDVSSGAITKIVMASNDQLPFAKPNTVEEIDYKEIEILEVS